MKPTSTVAQVKAHWDSQAMKSELSEAAVTHSDPNQRLLEIDLVLQNLPLGQRVLDVGCGNGFSTAAIANHAAHVTAVDYSATMIERARRKYGDVPNIDFQVQDVLNLNVPEAAFDAAISQRCLINLTSWEEQQRAIANIAQALKPGGIFILQEGTRQGRERLNQFREAVGLDRMPPVSFNLDFDEDLLWPFLARYFAVVSVQRLGAYDLISRVVHPLLVRPAEPKYDAKINEVARIVAARIAAADELGREFSAVLRRLHATAS